MTDTKNIPSVDVEWLRKIVADKPPDHKYHDVYDQLLALVELWRERHKIRERNKRPNAYRAPDIRAVQKITDELDRLCGNTKDGAT